MTFDIMKVVMGVPKNKPVTAERVLDAVASQPRGIAFRDLRERMGRRARGRQSLLVIVGPLWKGLSYDFVRALHALIWSRRIWIDERTYRLRLAPLGRSENKTRGEK
jgi:hypothetical protein